MRTPLKEVLCFLSVWVIGHVDGIPQGLLYEHNVPEAVILPKTDDGSSREIKLKEPIVFFGNSYDSIYVSTCLHFFGNISYNKSMLF